MANREYRPGETVEYSGVYEVLHDRDHAEEHEVTVVAGRKFPPCNHCGNHPRFHPIRLAQHIDRNKHFKS
jgi:hypothetical protein